MSIVAEYQKPLIPTETDAQLFAQSSLTLGAASTPTTEGQQAEAFDLCQSWSAQHNLLKSRSSNTPYQDAALTGKVIKTWPPR